VLAVAMSVAVGALVWMIYLYRPRVRTFSNVVRNLIINKERLRRMEKNLHEVKKALEQMRDDYHRGWFQGCLVSIAIAVDGVEGLLEEARSNKELEVFVKELEPSLSILKDLADKEGDIRKAVGTVLNKGLKLAEKLS